MQCWALVKSLSSWWEWETSMLGFGRSVGVSWWSDYENGIYRTWVWVWQCECECMGEWEWHCRVILRGFPQRQLCPNKVKYKLQVHPETWMAALPSTNPLNPPLISIPPQLNDPNVPLPVAPAFPPTVFDVLAAIKYHQNVYLSICKWIVELFDKLIFNLTSGSQLSIPLPLDVHPTIIITLFCISMALWHKWWNDGTEDDSRICLSVQDPKESKQLTHKS